MSAENEPILRDTRLPFPEIEGLVASVRPLGTSVRTEVRRLVDLSSQGIRFSLGKKFLEKVDLDFLLLHRGYKLKCIVSVNRVNPEGDTFDTFATFETISQKNLKALFQMVNP